VDLNIQGPIPVVADRRMLAIALDNLIGNAWKFTSERLDASITVGENKQNGESVFFVRDNGVGFDMGESEKLFGTFQRLRTSANFEGYGIGLANVRRIVSRHGGRIWAVSEPGRGATFYFTLRAWQQQEAPAEAGSG
jgi:signal transduction histidine kinase